MGIEMWAAVVSTGTAVLSAVGATFAWIRANLSRQAREGAERAELRAAAQVKAAQEQAAAAQESARGAGGALKAAGGRS
jgi:hypothetical protein